MKASPSELAERWHVRVHRVSETPRSLLVFGTRHDEPVVLKVARTVGDEWHAGAVVAAFRGRGMVRVLEQEPGAVLMEELRPGTQLVELVAAGRDAEATRIIAGVIRSMELRPDVESGFATAAAWGEAFNRYLADGDRQIPSRIVEDASERYSELCRTQVDVRLLHGDLQHYNILYDDARGWTAIDPKGVSAEVEYELGAALRNPRCRPELCSAPAAVRRRIELLADELDIDPERAAAWAYVQAVLSGIWAVEDGDVLDGSGPVPGLAAALRPLLH